MNEIAVDAVDALRIVHQHANQELFRGIGIALILMMFVVVFCIGVFPAITRAWRRLSAFAKLHPIQFLILLCLSMPVVHYGATKFVKPVSEVSSEVTSEGVAFEWSLDGMTVTPTTQFLIEHSEVVEVDGQARTNWVQQAIVDGTTQYAAQYAGADAVDWRISYLPPVVVEGDDIRVTRFEHRTDGIDIEWECSDKIVLGTDLFRVMVRYRQIPSRTGWGAWQERYIGTGTSYSDTAFHYCQDEEWKIECTKEDDQ